VRVQDAPDIAIGDKSRNAVGFGEFDFLATLPQLRFNELQTECGVNLLFLSSDNLPAGVPSPF
jgi:hypothetical protein